MKGIDKQRIRLHDDQKLFRFDKLKVELGSMCYIYSSKRVLNDLKKHNKSRTVVSEVLSFYDE